MSCFAGCISGRPSTIRNCKRCGLDSLRMPPFKALLRFVRTTSGVDRLVLLGVANASDVEKSLRELGLDSQIPVVIDPGDPKIEDARRSIVLIGTEDRRKS